MYYIITGTSRGLGNALVKLLSKKSNTRILCISRKNNNDLPTNAQFFGCNLRNYRSIENIMGKVVQSIDGYIANSITLINNAAVIGPIGSIESLSAEDIAKIYKVDLLAPAILMSQFIKHTQHVSVKKTIINISSGAAFRAYGGISIYSSSKAGLDQLTKCVSIEQTSRKLPVRIIALHVCSMDTNMQDEIRSVSEAEFPNISRFITMKEEGKLAKPDFMATQVMKFLENNHLEQGSIWHIDKDVVYQL